VLKPVRCPNCGAILLDESGFTYLFVGRDGLQCERCGLPLDENVIEEIARELKKDLCVWIVSFALACLLILSVLLVSLFWGW